MTPTDYSRQRVSESVTGSGLRQQPFRAGYSCITRSGFTPKVVTAGYSRYRVSKSVTGSGLRIWPVIAVKGYRRVSPDPVYANSHLGPAIVAV